MKSTLQNTPKNNFVSRRDFVHGCAFGIIALASGSLTSCLTAKKTMGFSGPASQFISLDQDWLFGGKFNPASINPSYDDTKFSHITLPHCVTKLSWQDWNTDMWQDVWGYRRYFTLPQKGKGMRVFLHFDGVSVGASPTINGHTLPQHLGGYLPFKYEITEWLSNEENVLTVAVDSHWSNVPPQGSPLGAKGIDYLEAGGITRSVYLQVVPQNFISDVFAKPVKVLDRDRRIDVTCTMDTAILSDKPVQIVVEMKQGDNVVSRSQKSLNIEKTGQTEVVIPLSDFKNITLWDINNPHLYDIVTTLLIEGKPIHDYKTRIGLRDARFEVDGFFLNGNRLQLFGLNRHEIYPYVGFAMPDRVMRRDAEILRHEFNCNIVRCSHYPQTEAFMNACDEIGLMVWEEVPGFQYLGNEPWKELLVRDVKDMIIRDRNHPSVIIWGTRVNESHNNPELYKQTKELAKYLDNSRPSSGSIAPWSRKNWEKEWDEDVFAFDDYHSNPDGSVGLEEPIKGFPYMFAEAVGQFNYTTGKSFDSIYRRGAEIDVQQKQALRHAQAHSRAASNSHTSGAICWCAFEYASYINPYRMVKYPGVADIFRIPKLGASFYQSQGDPKSAPAIHPNFYWDFGSKSPKGPGKNAAIFSNCEKLELFINGKQNAVLYPDIKNYPNLKHAPFFADLEMTGDDYPELRIDGYVGALMVLSISFSSNSGLDQFALIADDQELSGDGSDATRVVFRVTDKFGAARPFAKGNVLLKIEGPGIIVGDNPFDLEESGGAGAVWVKTTSKSSGHISLHATHPSLGTKTIKIIVRKQENYPLFQNKRYL